MGDMAAEHTAQDVQLVDDDIAQPHQQRRPLRVVGEDPGVEHLGVGQNQVGVGPHPGPLFGGAVAVVGGGDEVGIARLDDRAQLIVGEGLGREEGQGGAGSDRIGDRLGDRELVTQRLARRRAGGHDGRCARSNQVGGRRLVRPQPIDPRPVPDGRREGVGGVGVRRRPGREPFDVDDPAVGVEPIEQPVERRGFEQRHAGPSLRVAGV